MRPDINATQRDFDAIYARHTPPQLLVEGDSILDASMGTSSQSILYWCGFDPRDYIYNPTSAHNGGTGDNYAVPGSISNVTGSTPSINDANRIGPFAARVALEKAKGVPVAPILSIGMNGNADTLIEDIQKWANPVFAAGADYIGLMNVDPSGGTYKMTEAVAAKKLRNNLAMAEYARRNSTRLLFSDSYAYLLGDKLADDNVHPQMGDANNSPGSTAYDGFHTSGFGAYLKAKALMGLLRQITPPAPPSSIISPFGAANVRGNLMGGAGCPSIGGGQASQNKIGAGLIGIENFSVYGGDISGSLPGITCTISLVRYTPIFDLTGRSDVLRPRFTFAGTPTGAWNLEIGTNRNLSSGDFPAGTPMRLEGDFYFGALKNFRHFSIHGGIGGDRIGLGNNANTSFDSDTITVPVTGRFRPRSSHTVPLTIPSDGGTFSGGMGLGGPAGREVSGYFEYGGVGSMLQPALPSATA